MAAFDKNFTIQLEKGFFVNSLSISFTPPAPAAPPPPLKTARSVVHPCIFEGKPTLFFEKGLANSNPGQYQLHVEFATQHGFQLLEERRGAKKTTHYDRRRASLPMLVLGASVAGFAQPNLVLAHSNGTTHDTATNAATAQILENDEQIVHQLLAWIRAQDITVATLLQSPNVERSSQQEMLRLAFGERMPASMGTSELKVYGLYNFETKQFIW